MPPNVLTVFCAGTDFDSSSDDIIAKLARLAGTRGEDYLFFPGPGSNEALPALIRDLDVVEAGTFAAMPVVDAAARLGRGQAGPQLYDSATGRSVMVNVRAAVQQMRTRVARGGTVNLAGWSRGAVTCVGIAYAMAKDPALASARVNLFLFDPVPGPKSLNSWNWTEELGTLRGNVASLAVVLMEDENRVIAGQEFMAPLLQPFTTCRAGACGEVPADRIQLYPMPGEHASAVLAGGAFTPAAAIGAHLCTSFLLERGTRLRQAREQLVGAGLLSGPRELVEHYAALKLAGIRQAMETRYTVRTAAVPNAERDGLFYVNVHHRYLFATAFPVLAQLLDARFEAARWSENVLTEAGSLRRLAPKMADLVASRLIMHVMPASTLLPSRPRRDHADHARLLEALLGNAKAAAKGGASVAAPPAGAPGVPRDDFSGPSLRAPARAASDW